jgi:hypothetical protein
MKTLGAEDLLALARGGALLLAVGTALRALDWVFPSQPIVAVVIGAFLLDLWAQRIDARWMAPGRTSSSSVTTFPAAAGAGLALGLFVLAAAVAFGAAHASVARISAASIGIGVLRTAAYAFRDELLLRGVPLALANGYVPPAWSLAFCVALGAAPLVFSAGGFAPIALAAASSFLFATIWQMGAGGIAAWATHAGWRIAIEVVAGGSVLEVTYEKGALPSIEGASGLPAYLATAAFALSAVAVLRRNTGPRQATRS